MHIFMQNVSTAVQYVLNFIRYVRILVQHGCIFVQHVRIFVFKNLVFFSTCSYLCDRRKYEQIPYLINYYLK